jgi:hypothetical protein
MPEKVLGWFDLPENQESFTIRQMPDIRASDFMCAHEAVPLPVAHYIEIKEYMHGLFRREWAIYSDDRPIEFWRKIPGFIENPNWRTP